MPSPTSPSPKKQQRQTASASPPQSSPLPRELLLCVFIHGFVLPFPRWVRQGILGRTAQAQAEKELRSNRSRPLPALLPISPLTIVSHFAPPSPNPTAGTPNTPAPPDPHATALPLAPPNSFKGTDGTFCGFPERLKHVLTETLPGTKVECVVFPAYETRGELAEATARFVSWLTELTVNLEASHGLRAGGARIVLCGHSMGGLVAADALLGIAGSGVGPAEEEKQEREGEKDDGKPSEQEGDGDGDGKPEQRPMWPRIIACIGYDTPYLGLHPNVFKHSVSQVSTYVDAAKSVAAGLGLFGLGGSAVPSSPTPQPQVPAERLLAPPSPGPAQSPSGKQSPWAKLAGLSPTYVAAAAGTLLAGAAAGTAFYKRQELAGGWQWASDHLRYVGNLWDEGGMRRRMEGVVDTGVVFRNFYTLLPASVLNPQERNFSLLPSPTSPLRALWRPQTNTLAKDEVDAHIGMFEPRSNDGYYELGLEVVSAVREAVDRFALPASPAAGRRGGEGEREGEVGAEEVRRRVEHAESAQPEAAAMGQAAADDLIDLGTSPPSSSSVPHPPPTSSSSTSGQTHAGPPTPSSYPSTSTPFSAVPSSAQFSELPWSARASAHSGAEGGGWGEKEGARWAGVPLEGVPVTPEEEEAVGAGTEGGKGEWDAGSVEVENPWVGRLRRKDRKK